MSNNHNDRPEGVGREDAAFWANLAHTVDVITAAALTKKVGAEETPSAEVLRDFAFSVEVLTASLIAKRDLNELRKSEAIPSRVPGDRSRRNLQWYVLAGFAGSVAGFFALTTQHVYLLPTHHPVRSEAPALVSILSPPQPQTLSVKARVYDVTDHDADSRYSRLRLRLLRFPLSLESSQKQVVFNNSVNKQTEQQTEDAKETLRLAKIGSGLAQRDLLSPMQMAHFSVEFKKAIQIDLVRNGYYSGFINGEWNEDTVAGVKKFLAEPKKDPARIGR